MPSRKPTPGKRFGGDGYGLTVTGLDPRQAALLQAWLPGAEHVADLSWGIVGTTVLRMRHEGRDVVVKAGDAADRHIARELRAHREWLGPWHGSAPELLHGDADAKLLVTGYLPGELVEGRPEETDPGTYRQAGRLLARLHEQACTVDHGYERRMRERSLGHLDSSHRIDPELTARLRAEVASWRDEPATLVPTHGDWQPRNWLVHDGVVAVIDLGRADLRPAHTDLCRLEVQQFRGRPDLDAAFVDGYGRDPRTQPGWRRELLREAIATAVWAFRVGDEAFERQGHRMITDALGG
ncbi:MAG: aminoglycoside phosphotransferase family protein [Pseudonocardiaceae bacterium]|nr:MAG: aminoglycoside phosphotransferase family protein [Pseudonocardiaceae bacterium]